MLNIRDFPDHFPEVTVGQISTPDFNLADSAEVWAARIAAAADLPDQRLNTRLADILTTLARQPNDAIPHAAGNCHHAKSIYRFFQNRRFDHHALVAALAQVTAQCYAGQDRVYLVHDSSSLNYGSLKSTTGLGRLGRRERACGLMLHSVLALSPDGIVRGLLALDLWSRPLHQKTWRQRYQRRFEDKESFKWLRGLSSARAAFNNTLAPERAPRRLHLMDREGDIHQVFENILAHGESAIIRCAQNRRVDGSITRAHAAVAASPLLGETTFKVRTKGNKWRKATVQLRALSVLLLPSQTHFPDRPPLSLNLIEVRELDAPAGGEPVHWRLWTTESIGNLGDILECLRAYTLRWRIEEYHLALKSGCNTEGLLLETAERLCKAIVLYAAVATRIVALRDLGRHSPDAPCTVLLSHEECRVLSARFGDARQSGTIPTIRQAMLWIGRLGGHLGRKRDGLPGVRTLWRGWRDLAIMVYGYRLSRY